VVQLSVRSAINHVSKKNLKYRDELIGSVHAVTSLSRRTEAARCEPIRLERSATPATPEGGSERAASMRTVDATRVVAWAIDRRLFKLRRGGEPTFQAESASIRRRSIVAAVATMSDVTPVLWAPASLACLRRR
jgi:hypothetical protein